MAWGGYPLSGCRRLRARVCVFDQKSLGLSGPCPFLVSEAYALFMSGRIKVAPSVVDRKGILVQEKHCAFAGKGSVSSVGAEVEAAASAAVVAALAGRTRAAVAAAGAAPLSMVPARPGDVPVLLDMGIEVARVPGLAHALDLPLRRSDAEDGRAPVGSAFDRHSAPVGVFPDVWVVWAAAVLALHAVPSESVSLWPRW